MSALRQMAIALVLIVSVGLLVYANSFNAPFVLDDIRNIVENPHIRVDHFSIDKFTGLLKSQRSRPFAYLTFALNYYFHQYDETGYHIVNVIIHLLSAGLVFLITRQTLTLCRYENAWIAVPVALLWLVNPVHTQSVTYLVQRMNALAAMFYLLAMVCYIQGRLIRRRSNGGDCRSVLLFSLSVLAGLLGLLSKQITATLPVMIFLYEWYFFQNLDKGWFRKQALRISATSVVIAVIVMIYVAGTPLTRLSTLYAQYEFTLSQRLLTEPGVLLYYLSLLVYPYPGRLQLIYDFPQAESLFSTPVLFPLAALIGLISIALRLRHKYRLVSFAIVWFLVNLVIESTILPLAIIFEHRTYLPSVFVFMALCAELFRKTTATKILVFACAGIFIHGLWTWQRNDVWADKFTFWADAVMKTPNDDRTNNNHGMELLKINQTEKAEFYFRRALELNPLLDKAHNNLGLILMFRGQNDLARFHFKQALAITPDFEAPYNSLGIACFRKGETEQALAYFKKALALEPEFSEAAGNLEKAIRTLKQYGQTISRLQGERLKHPTNSQVLRQLAMVCHQANMDDLAVDIYEQVLDLDPNCEECLDNLARIYWATNRYDKATQMLKRLTMLYPDIPKFFYSLACAYAKDNQKINAVESLKQAVTKGFTDIDYIRQDNALASIRDTDYFQILTGSKKK